MWCGHLVLNICDASMLLGVLTVRSFLSLYNIPRRGCTTACVPVLFWMSVRVSGVGLLGIKLL